MKRRQWGKGLAAGVLALSMLGAAWLAGPGVAQNRAKKRVMVISHAAGFRHSSIPVASASVRYLGLISNQWEVVAEARNAQEVASMVTAEKLREIDMVFFANTTGDIGITPEGKTAFYQWIRDGGAYVGVHSAGDTYHDDSQYLDLVRGEFSGHGPQLTVDIYNQDPEHPATKKLPAQFQIFDEIYEYKNWSRDRVHVLLSMKKRPRPDSKEMGDFPVAWTNRLGKGRMFYTSLGHREDVYMNGLYLNHLMGGIRWALGFENGDDTPGNPIR